jgi:aquaporin related protein
LLLLFARSGLHLGCTYGTADGIDSLYIAIIFGASLAANVWCFFRISGGLFNPAVTLSFVVIGGITPIRGVLLFIAQIAGGLAVSL